MMAKNNSNRLENKNIMEFANGLTLFEFSLKENLKYPWFDDFFVISNSHEIEEICKRYPEVIFINEPEILAKQDDSYVVIKFLLKFTGLFPEDILVYVPTTAPLRIVNDIRNALALYTIDKFNDCNSVVSVVYPINHPEWSFRIKDGYLDVGDLPMTSQELKTYYHLNAAIYIASIKTLEKYDGFFKGGKVIPYLMPFKRSINIDNLEDFKLAQYYYKKNKS